MLRDTTGKTVTGIRRVRYVRGGDVSDDTGPLELEFQDGTSIIVDAGADGEKLTLTPGPWVDPFREPLSEENRRFVESSGKWTLCELTPQDPLRRAIGHQVARVDELRNLADSVVGAHIQLDNLVLQLAADSDELLIDVV
jgi:hypothetical protein